MASTGPISKLITGQKVKDTVAQSQATQSSILSTVKSGISKLGGLASGLSNMMSNAENIISSTISGFVSNIADSIGNFSKTVNNGITTSLPDLSKKNGSMISQLSGNVNTGAVCKKLSFIVDNANPSISATSLFGQGSNVRSLLNGFTNSELSKISAASGMTQIANNSDLNVAMSTLSSQFHSFTANANSLSSQVLGMPNRMMSNTATTVDSGVSSLISKITTSVTNLSGISGIGSQESLIEDVYNLYKTGRNTYEEVAVKGGENLVGYVSRFNESFPETESLIKLASSICKAMNGKMDFLEAYGKNKDLFDLLLSRLANCGLYGAINDLLHCNDTQSYVDESTFSNLANQFKRLAAKGDVLTAKTIQEQVGNGRLSDTTSQMKALATKIDDQSSEEIQAYVQLLNQLNIPKEQILGKQYESNSGSFYAYSIPDLNNYYSSSPNLTNSLLGGTNTANMASKLSQLIA